MEASITITQIGIDIGKTTFHVIGLGPDGAIVARRRLPRSQLIRFFQDRADDAPAIAFEADFGARWLARQLVAMGHEVRLLTPESVRPFAKAQNNGSTDAVVSAR